MTDRFTWVITDGRAGLESQALGLAEAVGWPIRALRLKPPAPWAALPPGAWPTIVRRSPDPLRFLRHIDENLSPPWPSLLIGTGRHSIPYSLAIGALSAGRTFTVQTQNPRVPCDCFDLVVPPYHDLYAGPNVEPMLGSPHRVTARRLIEEADAVAPLLAHLPRPLVAVLIGGPNKVYGFPPERMETLCEDLAALTRAHGAGLAVTASRRTGDKLTQILRQRLQGLPAHVWDGRGLNPYFGFLGLADHILVTADSINMTTEAAATGKPVHVLPLPGGSRKFRRFHRDFMEYGATRWFDGTLTRWSYRPLDETARVAALIRARVEALA